MLFEEWRALKRHTWPVGCKTTVSMGRGYIVCHVTSDDRVVDSHWIPLEVWNNRLKVQ